MDYLEALWVMFLFACGVVFLFACCVFFALVTVVYKVILLVVAGVARGAEQIFLICRIGVSGVRGRNPKMTK